MGAMVSVKWVSSDDDAVAVVVSLLSPHCSCKHEGEGRPERS